MDVMMSDAMKVFLSHKSLDKELVTNFKETLRLLGFDPWIDEDAMPAGTHLERGLLQGMQDSCGAVFFITPSFQDKGYLATEVDYAIQEKREKGDKFAIVTLQFVDDNGEVGEIPKLLKPYVWKKPKTHLEALREIIRALPIKVGDIDWREDIKSKLQTTEVKSKSVELSKEAKAILLTATEGNGEILLLNTANGQHLHVNNECIIPAEEHDPRTIALWVGGLNDLGRYALIQGDRRNGFKVSRDGYKSADAIREEARESMS
jgi:TIR domain